MTPSDVSPPGGGLVGNPTLAFQPWELEFTTLNDVYVLGPITDPPEVFANNLVISQLRAFQVDKGAAGPHGLKCRRSMST
jgi:hypothetical protein